MGLANGVGQGLWGGTTGLSGGSGFSTGAGRAGGTPGTAGVSLTDDSGAFTLMNDASTITLTPG